MDCTFLSNQKKVAISGCSFQDEKDKIFLFAFAIVEFENSSSWKYFLEKIK